MHHFTSSIKLIKRYFEEEVDENTNKLLLALSVYFDSEWFTWGCKVYNTFEAIIIQPSCELLGIDKFKDIHHESRNWISIKAFFKSKQLELKKFALKQETNFEKLTSECAYAILEMLDRQLNRLAFFVSQVGPEVLLNKMLKAPMTNSGCESRSA